METRLEQEIGNLLRERGLTIAIAESSTGGLISHLITDVPGSSSYFKGTVVAYDNEVKIKILGVKRETLEKYKSVSYQTGEEMAQRVREALDADIGLLQRSDVVFELQVAEGQIEIRIGDHRIRR